MIAIDDLLMTVLSMLIGALITCVTSRCYYEKAGKDLQQTADELNKSTNRVLRWLDLEGKDVSVVYDKDGNVLGLARGTTMSDQVSISARPISGELKTPAPQ